MIKALSRVGNSQALILDKTMLGLTGVDESGEVELRIEGSRLIVSPVHDEKRRKQVDASSAKMIKRFAKTCKRLAEPRRRGASSPSRTCCGSIATSSTMWAS